MAKTRRPSKKVQVQAVNHISSFKTKYEDLMQSHKRDLLEIYREVRTFKQAKMKEWSTSFKVNKMYEVENKVLPKIISKNPKWIVSPRIEGINTRFAGKTPEEIQKELAIMKEGSVVIQKYLNHIFETTDLKDKIRIWAKGMLRYGYSWARTRWKFETTRIEEEDGIEEKVTGEFPTMEIKSWADIYFDPRYKTLDEMPAVIETLNRVRFSDLTKQKELFNMDKLKDIFKAIEDFKDDENGFASRMASITGIQYTGGTTDKNALYLNIYYGYFQPDGQKEKMYKITTVNNNLVIGYEEITRIPFEDAKCFDDTDNYFPVGFIQPILGIQQEMNFKKNSVSEAINSSLNREWIWSPNSKINPKDLVSRPGNIIPTTADAQTAQANLVELDKREVPGSYFSEQQDMERQIQSLTFTIDVVNRSNIAGQTNTATGERIQFFESNQVIDQVRRNFENAMARLANQLLQETFENLSDTDNIILENEGSEEFFIVNRALLKNAVQNYDIRVETGSTSFDSLEDRRQDAIAKYNLGIGAAQAGVNIDLQKLFLDVLGTFEGVNAEEFIKAEIPQPPEWAPQPIEGEEPVPEEAAQLTQDVTGGTVTGEPI